MKHQRPLSGNRQIERRSIAMLAVVILLLSAGSLEAQNPACRFALRLGNSGSEQGESIAVDSAGNIYVTGLFSREVDFDPGPGSSTLVGIDTGTVYVAKYDGKGRFIRAFGLGGTGGGPPGKVYANSGLCVAVDGGGDLVVMGFHSGSSDFDPGPDTTILTAREGTVDMFLARYSPEGELRWAFSLPVYVQPWYSTQYATQHSLAVDSRGYIVIGGFFKGVCDFDPGPETAELSAYMDARGDPDLFVARYTSAGRYSWAFQLGTLDYESVQAVTVDRSDNVVITGTFAHRGQSMNLNPHGGTTLYLTPPHTDDIFVAKYTPEGTVLWGFAVGSPGSDRSLGIRADADNNLLLVGHYQNSIDFDPGDGVAILAPYDSTSANIFIARYDSMGNYLWAIGPGAGWGSSLAVDGNGDILVTGGYRGRADFDPGADTAWLASSPIAFYNCFVAGYASSGEYRFAFGVPGTPSRGMGIVSDGEGNMYLTGQFGPNGGSSDFDPEETTTTLTSAGGYDAFIAGYGREPVSGLPAGEIRTRKGMTMEAAPNPFTEALSIRFHASSSPVRIRIIDMIGRVVETVESAGPRGDIELGSKLPPGAYLLQIIQGEERRTMMIHKVE